MRSSGSIRFVQPQSVVFSPALHQRNAQCNRRYIRRHFWGLRSAVEVPPKQLDTVDQLGIAIVYQQEQQVDYSEVSTLLHKVGWPPRRQSRLQTAVENSFFLATLRAHNSPDDEQLIGFARIVSDGAFNAQIWDVIIDPAFQEKGLGRKLIEEIVRHLTELDIKNITTFAEKPGTKFYEKLGFQSDPDGVRGMFWRQMQ